MRYDALVIGAGMSGLAAGIRLAQAGRRVAVLEKHSLWGGLNSYYKLSGRRFDVGLHALTNYVPARTMGAPLTRILRQLRIPYEALELGEQSGSESAFRLAGAAGAEILRLGFANGPELLRSEVARLFPSARARFEALLADLPEYGAAPQPRSSARAELARLLREPLLEEMLLCPVSFYGAAGERDLPWTQFGVLFRSIFLEGFARPEGGIKRLLDVLVGRLREEGAELRLRCGVERILARGGAAAGVRLESGEELEAEQVFSSAGWPETVRLLGGSAALPPPPVGSLSFFESISVLERAPAELGLARTVVFFNHGPAFEYACPPGLVGVRSGVICAPNNYRSRAPLSEGLLRVTVLASHARWRELEPDLYARAKERACQAALDAAAPFAFDPRPHTRFRDAFTPLTIERFTSRLAGAVYGSPAKLHGGETPVRGLFVCGTDEGLVGVVGALASGIAVANARALVARGA